MMHLRSMTVSGSGTEPNHPATVHAHRHHLCGVSMWVGMRMGMGPMAMGGMGMQPFMNNAVSMMGRNMGMMGGAGGALQPMGRTRGVMNAGVGPARNMARGHHGFHPYAR